MASDAAAGSGATRDGEATSASLSSGCAAKEAIAATSDDASNGASVWVDRKDLGGLLPLSGSFFGLGDCSSFGVLTPGQGIAELSDWPLSNGSSSGDGSVEGAEACSVTACSEAAENGEEIFEKATEPTSGTPSSGRGNEPCCWRRCDEPWKTLLPVSLA